MPVQFQNTNGGPLVFHDPLSKQQVEWAGRGDRNGEDFQYVPDEIVEKNVQFRKIVRLGHLTKIEEESVEAQEAQMAQVLASRGAQDGAAAQAQSVMLGGQDNDLVSLGCVGPARNGRAGAKCDQPVLVKSRRRNEEPPLCEQHASLKSDFIAETDESQNGPDGKAAVRWIKAGGLEPRQRA